MGGWWVCGWWLEELELRLALQLGFGVGLGNIVTQCFAVLWLHNCINYIYDAGVQDDTLPLRFIEIKITELHLNLCRVFLICIWGSLFPAARANEADMSNSLLT